MVTLFIWRAVALEVWNYFRLQVQATTALEPAGASAYRSIPHMA
jgi:hypothetical protein